MPRKRGPPLSHRCLVCQHPLRGRIELLMARGAGRVSVSKQFSVSESSIKNHWAKHTPATIKAAAIGQVLKPGADIEKLLNDEDVGLLEHLQRIRGILFQQFDAAAEAGDRHGVAMLSGRLLETLRLGAQKTGELSQHHGPHTSITNVVLSPAYLELRGRLLMALRKHPEASQAVSEAFRAVEQQTGLIGPVVDHNAA
jgi:hypothetical protein